MCGKFEFVGNIESEDGMKIIFKVDDIVVGFVSLINFGKVFDVDYEVVLLYDDFENTCCSGLNDDFFDRHNSIFIHSLNVNSQWRSKGFGLELLNECHNITKKNNLNYCLLVVDKDNYVAQSLYKKNSYQIHLLNEKKILYYKVI
jgi:ribosomal protein S18 acetylase RimI-like enzyme